MTLRWGLGRTWRAGLATLCLLPLEAHAQGYADSRCRLTGASQSSVGVTPFALAAGDVTGDGIDDIATADSGSNSITVLKAMGGGQFQVLLTLVAGVEPRDVVLADVSGDGKRDLLAVAYGSHQLQVWLGLGNGGFGSPSSYPTSVGPAVLAVGDFNADGHPDVIVGATNNQASVFLGTGSGAFAARVDYPTEPGPSGVGVADFNADGKLDVAFANSANDTVSVLAGQGNGSFGPPQSLPAGSGTRDLLVADVNGDGKPDLVVANWNASNLTMLLGQGNGSFAAAPSLPVPALPIALAFADLDSDGKSELVVAHETSVPNQISVLAGLGGGAFAAPSTQPVAGVRPHGLAVGNFNADGIPDLAVAAYTDNQASVLLGECAPVMNFAPKADVDLGSSYALRKSPLWKDRSRPDAFTHVMIHLDVDRDGDTDLVRASLRHFEDTPIEVLRNDAGVFTDQSNVLIPGVHPPMRYPRKGLNGDFNDDGWPDFVLLDTGDDAPPFPGAPSRLYLSDGGGTLGYSPQLEQWSGYFHGGASADIDGNGSQDVLMLDSTGKPFLLINDGLGNFSRDTVRLPVEMLRGALYTAEMMDLDLDGYVDIIVSSNEFTVQDAGVMIYWGSGSGLYRTTSSTAIPKPAGNGGVLDFAAEDIDHDGDRDLVIYRFPDFFATNERYFQILPQVASRQFVDQTAARMTMTHAQPAFDYIRMQDVNGDGHVDIFADDRHFESVGEYAWTNNGGGVFAPYFGAVAPALPYTTIDIADVATTEGPSGTKQMVFQARLNRPATAPVTFNVATVAGTATAGSDFVAKTSNGVVIGAGQSSADFAVTVNGDAAVESDEAFTVQLGAVSGARVLRGRAFGYIENDDAYRLSVDDVTVVEGNAGQTLANFTLSLSPASPAPISVDVFTSAGTAAPGADFVTTAQAGKTIPAGQTSVGFAVPVIGDTVVERHETFTVNLVNPVGAVLQDAQGQGRISNDDLAQLSVSDAAIVEGNAGGSTLGFVVRLSHPMPNPVTFDIATASGTATGGSDFVARALTGRFLDAGRTQWRFEVQVNGDAQVEPDETFSAVVSNVVGAGVADATGSGSILNDDAAASRAAGARTRLGGSGQAERPRNRAP